MEVGKTNKPDVECSPNFQIPPHLKTKNQETKKPTNKKTNKQTNKQKQTKKNKQTKNNKQTRC